MGFQTSPEPRGSGAPSAQADQARAGALLPPVAASVPLYPFEPGAGSLPRLLTAIVHVLEAELDGRRLEAEARGCVVRALANLRDACALQELGSALPVGIPDPGPGHVSHPDGFTLPHGVRFTLTPRGRRELRIARGELGVGAHLAEWAVAEDQEDARSAAVEAHVRRTVADVLGSGS